MIFIDRSIPRPVAQALQHVQDDVRWLEDVFPHNTPDTVWLPDVGARGWLVITRDKRIRTPPGERQAIIDGRVGCFCLTQKQALVRWQYLKLLALTLDDMERLFAQTSRPFLCGVSGTGQLRLLPLGPAGSPRRSTFHPLPTSTADGKPRSATFGCATPVARSPSAYTPVTDLLLNAERRCIQERRQYGRLHGRRAALSCRLQPADQPRPGSSIASRPSCSVSSCPESSMGA